MTVNLRKYIADVRTIEIQKETLSRCISSINYSINQLCRPRTICARTNPINLSFGHMFSGRIIIAVVALFFALYFTSLGVKDKSTEYYVLATGQMVYGDGSGAFTVAGPFWGIVAIVILSMVIQYVIQKRRFNEYEQSISIQYRTEKKQEDERIARERVLQNNYREVASILHDCYDKTCGTLNALYGKNIIYPKYQHDLVAICMFHEYFESGRCTTLTGHEGAYNIFEQELRLGIIINNLDIIIQKLDDIQRNQYSLYSALQHINSQQEIIIRSLNDISYKQNIQNENLECIRYNAAAMKRNSDIALLYALS